MAQVVTTGLPDLLTAVKKAQAGYDAAARTIVIQSAAVIEDAAKRQFIGSHGPGEAHVGGDQPNVVTGTLRRSITHGPVLHTGLASWSTTVGPTTVYGRRVELGYLGGGGGRGHQTTRPFPFLGPGVRNSTTRMQVIAATQWARVASG